jgi:uncharacterized protein
MTASLEDVGAGRGKARRGIFVVFAKWPREGHVKTRLARGLGAKRAADLARAFLFDTLAALVECNVRIVLAVDQRPDPGDLPAGIELMPQGSGDLGDRLERVLAQLLCTYDWAAAVGADSPGLAPSVFMEAATLLSCAAGPDAVLGPTQDGGYYLLGLRKMPPGLLRGIRWSSPFAMADTEANLAKSGFVVALLPKGFDIDEPEDLEAFRVLLQRGNAYAPRTRAALGLADQVSPGTTLASSR